MSNLNFTEIHFENFSFRKLGRILIINQTDYGI